jgi:uncharacterized protein (DUF2164 family)
MPKTIKIPRQDKDRLVADLQDYLSHELGEQLGNIAAEGLLDHVLSLVAPYVYNQAIEDTKQLISNEWARLDEELNVLERPLPPRR